MSDSRDFSTLQLPESDRLKSTTARILVALCNSYFGKPDAPFNSASASATIQYATLGKLDAQEDVFSYGTSSMLTVKDVLDKLDVIFAQPRQDSYSRKNEYEVVKRNSEKDLQVSEELDRSWELLKQRYRQERDKILQSLQNLFNALSSARNPEERAHSQEVLNELGKIQTSCNALNNSFTRLGISFDNSRQRLQSHYEALYSFVPPTDREKLPPPISVQTPTLGN